jgi:PAS domain S-box-containing protein
MTEDPERLLVENRALALRVTQLEADVRRLEAERLAASEADEARFKEFFDKSPVGKCMTAPDGRLMRVNDALAAMLGYSVEELQAHTFASVTHPDDLAESREAVRALTTRERESWDAEKRYLTKDGSVVWTHITSRLVRDAKGKPHYFLTHIADITGHKEAEQKVESQIEELRRWQEVMLDREDRIQELKREVNELCRRLGEDARYLSQDPGPKGTQPEKQPQ